MVSLPVLCLQETRQSVPKRSQVTFPDLNFAVSSETSLACDCTCFTRMVSTRTRYRMSSSPRDSFASTSRDHEGTLTINLSQKNLPVKLNAA
jgi:hypothetical protein